MSTRSSAASRSANPDKIVSMRVAADAADSSCSLDTPSPSIAFGDGSLLSDGERGWSLWQRHTSSPIGERTSAAILRSKPHGGKGEGIDRS